eukprot:TRINITY_DN7503_c7_g5_i1.p1 TRINITY_DN7503_c7_g5~~TRINITY_DN7503_c7_g5_i1.p1  ORF type:complete len:851 (+),score=142.99 TRINITY_DN7503_c7_g5_i1:363-2555(+)
MTPAVKPAPVKPPKPPEPAREIRSTVLQPRSWQKVEGSKDVPAYFELVFNKKSMGGNLFIKFRDFTGSVYLRGVSSVPLDSVHSKDQEPQSEVENWPTDQSNDLVAAVSAKDPVVKVPRSVREEHQRLLVVAKSSAVSKAQITVELSCEAPCKNGGECTEGTCKCKAGWSGTTCQDRQCPDNCSGNGACGHNGVCSCNVGWSGKSCSVEETEASSEKGKVAVGEWAYFRVSCPETRNSRKDISMLLTYTLKKSGFWSRWADPMLYAGSGRQRPDDSNYAVRDMASWRSRSDVHHVTLPVRTGPSGGATIGIQNIKSYARAVLEYTGQVECVHTDVGTCPKTEHGDCNHQGKCLHDEDENEMYCECDSGWTGNACEQEEFKPSADKDKYSNLVLDKNDFLTVDVEIPQDKFGQIASFKIAGVGAWMGISVNADKRPISKNSPRSCDAHNYWDRWTWQKTRVSQVDIEVESITYSVMISNPILKQAKFGLQVVFSPASSGKVVVNKEPNHGVALDEHEDEPGDDEGSAAEATVPVQVIGSDGRLPDPVLKLSTSGGIDGLASSNHMRLIQAEEFCFSPSSPGYRVKCDKHAGVVTICSDKPAVIYHGLDEGAMPKDLSEFFQKTKTKPGAPESAMSWQTQCFHHAQVSVDDKNSVIGVAALRGDILSWSAVMHGPQTDYLQRDIFGSLGAIVVASQAVVLVLSWIFFGYYFRRQQKMVNVRTHSHEVEMSNC